AGSSYIARPTASPRPMRAKRRTARGHGCRVWRNLCAVRSCGGDAISSGMLRGGLPGHPRPARVEGDPRLLNRYDVILLDLIKHPEAKQQPARRFADWLVSPEGQAAIDAYKTNGEQLFHPSADAPKKARRLDRAYGRCCASVENAQFAGRSGPSLTRTAHHLQVLGRQLSPSESSE